MGTDFKNTIKTHSDTFANKNKIDSLTAEKVLWLSKILEEITFSPIGKDFALMGGSSVVFLYKNMYRFSTDLDLDFIGDASLGSKTTDEIKTRMDYDVAVFQNIAEKYGLDFEIQNRDERFGQYCLYFNKKLDEGKVELDVSYRYCHSILGPEMKNWGMALDGVIEPFSVQTLKIEELYASKITAIVDAKRYDFPDKVGFLFKKKARHLFDIYKLIEDFENNPKILDIRLLRNLVVLFGMTRIKNFEFLRGDSVGAYTPNQFQTDLVPVVPSNAKIRDPEDMKWKIRKFFDLHIYNWKDTEHQFVENYKRKNFLPEILFEDKIIIDRLKHMHYYDEIMTNVVPLKDL